MSGEKDSSYAMSGKNLEDSTMMPETEETHSTDEKVDSLLSQMTLEEKITMLGGKENLGIHGLPRLNIPDVWASDASAGARCYGRATAFPVPVALAATWSRDLQKQTGQAIGEECRAKGVSVLLGPGVNIYRVPTNGRNFEYMGEDPYLASELVVPYIQGVQSRGVITTVKHFACNNSDYDRHRMNSEVDERTLHEIYFPAFKAAVQKGKSKSVMCAYNPVNGVYASENKELLTDVLRNQWGFTGFVISDWTCVYSAEGPVKAGLDLEMPFGKYMNSKKLLPLLKKGKITEAMIDEKIRNMMRAFFETGAYSRSRKDSSFREYSKAHSLISLQAAREAPVLLKNDGILPLDRDRIRKIVLMGFNALETTSCGGGSCHIKSYDKVNIIDGIRKILPEETQIDCIAGNRGVYTLTESDKKLIQEADKVIFSAGFSNVEESECWDRSWQLPFRQDRLIKETAALNPELVVLLTAGGGVETESWLKETRALLHTFYLGENTGTAIAEILFGDVNPSGKLPFTMGRKWEDFGTTDNYVRKPDKISMMRIIGPQGVRGYRRIRTVKYKEKLMVGYRHFDTAGIKPQFPFGYGLSYTDFTISNVSLSKLSIKDGESTELTLQVQNTGNREGAEVVQLYIADDEASLIRPEKELKGFEKVYLKPGESQTVSFTISSEELSFYDPEKKDWRAEAGSFTLMTGNSSRSIYSETRLELID
ncbi:MAG: glycoside hydrolase family 3 N-terminal domain-containing protein [Spirochaetales bacterium]|nr:glycoside hydrolase family 3 N-terminal domain-containing protein [Spirochaetales bacterium]